MRNEIVIGNIYELLADALEMSAKKLKTPSKTKLDEYGLMPCGCGGKAEIVCAIEYWDWAKQSCVEVKKVRCDKCYMSTSGSVTNEYAMQNWNTAMGWRADDET